MPKFTFLWCLSVVASLNYLSQFSHKSKSSVNWYLMVSEFTWNIKSFVTLITIKINCDNCDTRFNDSGKLRHHKVSLHGFSCDNCYKWFNEAAKGLCSWRMVDKNLLNKQRHPLFKVGSREKDFLLVLHVYFEWSRQKTTSWSKICLPSQTNVTSQKSSLVESFFQNY